MHVWAIEGNPIFIRQKSLILTIFGGSNLNIPIYVSMITTLVYRELALKDFDSHDSRQFQLISAKTSYNMLYIPIQSP